MNDSQVKAPLKRQLGQINSARPGPCAKAAAARAARPLGLHCRRVRAAAACAHAASSTAGPLSLSRTLVAPIHRCFLWRQCQCQCHATTMRGGGLCTARPQWLFLSHHYANLACLVCSRWRAVERASEREKNKYPLLSAYLSLSTFPSPPLTRHHLFGSLFAQVHLITTTMVISPSEPVARHCHSCHQLWL